MAEEFLSQQTSITTLFTRKIREFHTKIVEFRHFSEVKVSQISQILPGRIRLKCYNL